MPSCRDITEHASEYLDRQLTPWQRLGFRLHLMICLNCRRHLDQLKLTIGTLGRLQAKSPPQPPAEQKVQEIVQLLKQEMGDVKSPQDKAGE